MEKLADWRGEHVLNQASERGDGCESQLHDEANVTCLRDDLNDRRSLPAEH